MYVFLNSGQVLWKFIFRLAKSVVLLESFTGTFQVILGLLTS